MSLKPYLSTGRMKTRRDLDQARHGHHHHHRLLYTSEQPMSTQRRKTRLGSWVLMFSIVVAALLPQLIDAGAGCAILNNCNGHGLCRTSYSSCECFTGWGASTDIAEYKAPDCSMSK